MVVEFSPRCDGCHAVFKAGGQGGDGGGGGEREPVSVGCFHTLCRACAEGSNGAYGKLQHLGNLGDEGEGEGGVEVEVEEYEVDPRVKEAVCGRCGVCGKGEGGDVVVRQVVLDALRARADGGGRDGGEGGEADFDNNNRSGGGKKEKSKKKVVKVEVKMCEVCGEEGSEGVQHVATHFCEDCNEHMCDSVANVHKRSKALSKHKLTEIEGVKRAAPPPLCPTHHEPFLNYFCKDDRCLVCLKCSMGDHNGHAFAEVGDELVEEMKGWLGEEIAHAEARVGELEEAEEGFVEDRDKVTANVRQAINDINAVFDELEKKRKELIEMVVGVRKEVCQRLNDARTTSQLLRQGIEAVQRAMRSLSRASFLSIQQGEQARQQLRQLVEGSGDVRTNHVDTMATFHHSDAKLKAWCDSLKVVIADPARESGKGVGGGGGGKWKARPGVRSRPLPSLNTAREGLSAAVATPSNDVFVVGGLGNDGGRLSSVERLAEGSDAWEEEAGLAIRTARSNCGACAVGTAVIVVGGKGSNGKDLGIVEAVDTVSSVHTTLPPLPQKKTSSCGVVSAQGKVIVTGGRSGFSCLDSAWALDVGIDANFQHQQQPLQWTSLPSMGQARFNHGAAAGGGCVFVCGGFDGNGNPLDSCEMLRVAVGAEGQGRWEALPPMPKALGDIGCCDGGGNVFVAGGYPGPQRSLFALNVRERKWAQVAELATARSRCAAVCVGRRVLVLGGSNGTKRGRLVSCEVFEF